MNKLVLLGGLALLVAGTSGCFHNNCGSGWRPGGMLFGSRQPTPAQTVQCCQPVQCCDPCAGATVVGSPVMSAPMAAPVAAPCCP